MGTAGAGAVAESLFMVAAKTPFSFFCMSGEVSTTISVFRSGDPSSKDEGLLFLLEIDGRMKFSGAGVVGGVEKVSWSGENGSAAMTIVGKKEQWVGGTGARCTPTQHRFGKHTQDGFSFPGDNGTLPAGIGVLDPRLVPVY